MRGKYAAPMTTTASAARIEGIDTVRGMAMILMALDQTRDFPGFGVNPVDPATTTTPLF
jgi:uncharacterized membrane protein